MKKVKIETKTGIDHEHKGKFFMVLMKCKCGTVGFPLTPDAAKRLKAVKL